MTDTSDAYQCNSSYQNSGTYFTTTYSNLLQYVEEQPPETRIRLCDDTVLKHYKRIMKIAGFQNLFQPITVCRKLCNFLYTFIVCSGIISCFICYTLFHSRYEFENYNTFSSWAAKLCVLPVLGYLLTFTLLKLQPELKTEALAERVFLNLSGPSGTYLCQTFLFRWIKNLLAIGLIMILLLGMSNVIRFVARQDTWLALGFYASAELIWCCVFIHFIIQCLLVIFYAEGLRSRILLQKVCLKESQRELLEIKSHLQHLQYYTVIPTVLVIYNMMENACVYYLNISVGLELFADLLSITLWIAVIAVPVLMNFKLSSSISSLTAIGAEIRCCPLLVETLSEQEINMFVLFLSSLKIRAPSLLLPSIVYILGNISLSTMHYLIVYTGHWRDTHTHQLPGALA